MTRAERVGDLNKAACPRSTRPVKSSRMIGNTLPSANRGKSRRISPHGTARRLSTMTTPTSSASQMCAACRATASNTAFRSPGVLAITRSTSLIALCCLQRFAQVLCALTQLVEQARVLDCDGGLIGERLEQRDVLVLERTHLRAADQDRASALPSRSSGTPSTVRVPAVIAISRPSGKSLSGLCRSAT